MNVSHRVVENVFNKTGSLKIYIFFIHNLDYYLVKKSILVEKVKTMVYM